MIATLSRLRKLIALLSARTYCPTCRTLDVTFSPLPDYYRENAQAHGFRYFGQGEMTALETYSCNNCGGSDRERLYAYWLNTEMSAGAIPKQSSVIHFAPEHSLSTNIRAQRLFSDYQTADLSMTGVDHHVDLMNLPFGNNSFDFFICSHVLEHVPDDRAAISELFRISRHGGRGLLMAPIIVGLSKTIEDSAATNESERWRLFGQNDHVRLYAHDDYVRRIEECGFLVQQLDQRHFGLGMFKRLGLKPTSVLYIVSKP